LQIEKKSIVINHTISPEIDIDAANQHSVSSISGKTERIEHQTVSLSSSCTFPLSDTPLPYTLSVRSPVFIYVVVI
jgi:hypothetical protein